MTGAIGGPFKLHDIVETVKGAKFWGEIIAFDTDQERPGCTVMAIAPDFAGTKHVYPLAQLRLMPAEPGHLHAAALAIWNSALLQPARGAWDGQRSGTWQCCERAARDVVAALARYPLKVEA